ncbi:unnamed protein product [Paramecium primaurelia]|uniref:WD domain, G-beta repeat protein n=1 Tax=Paramecium primaurelia TaxID=5886 RepID=A0A8S1MXR7_PARPR|nr:unnamed protein product [Paramecium primaurelia]
MEERLLCEICVKQEKMGSNDCISLEDANYVINNYSKKIESNLHPYLNEIQRKIQSIEQYIDQQKSNLNNLLNSILKNVQQWHQNLEEVIKINKNEKEFLNILDNIKRNEEDWLQDCELKITYEIQQLGYTYYHKIDKKLKKYADQLMDFKLTEKVIDIARISQEKCWNVYIDTSTIKKNQLVQKFKLIQCPEHKRIAEKINIEKNVPKNKRILCQECQLNGLDIESFIKTWDKIQYEKIDQQQKAQKYLQECYTNSLSKLEQLRNAQYKNLTGMINSVHLKIVDGSKCFQQIYLQSYDFSIDKFQELAEMCCQEQEKFELQTISQFLILLYQQGKAMVQDVKQILIKSRYENGIQRNIIQDSIKEEEVTNNNQVQLLQPESLSKTFQIQLMLPSYQVDQQEIYSMAFNRNGSLLLTGGDDEIKIFSFQEGKIEPLKKMSCQSSVSALSFSQQSNNFISGHIDGSLQIWNQKNRFDYQNLIYENLHMEIIRCLIINKQENELISSADDSIIRVHSLNLSKSQLQFKQSLKKHQKNVTSICLNQSETTLLSCSEDGQIIVWKQNAYQDWEFKNFINHSIKYYGKKIIFIRDNQFIWTQFNEKNILLFEEIDNIFIQRSQKSIINKNQQSVKFPFIYNSQFNLIICNHGKTIQLVTQQSSGSFQIVSSFQNQSNGQQIGVATNDSKYMVIWNAKQSEFKIFKLYS